MAIRPYPLNLRSERGAALVEYNSTISMIAVMCIGALIIVGGYLSASLNNSANALDTGGGTTLYCGPGGSKGPKCGDQNQSGTP